MDTIKFTANFKAARRVTVNGREFIVTSATMIVPGVLTGSRGPLFYPAATVAQNANDWEGTQITLNHPKSEDDRVVLGIIRNPKISKRKLVAEAWIDIDATKNADERILEAVTSGKIVEISTGFHGQYDDLPGVWNGKEYNEIVRDIRPDHLAVLPDAVGACSVDDGCGLNKNQKADNCSCKKEKKMTKTRNALTDEKRSELIDGIVENSNGLFSDDDAEKLESFTDNQLLKMRKQQESVENDFEKGYDDEDDKPRRKKKKPMMRKVGNTRSDDEDDEPVDKPTTNLQTEIKKYMKGLTAEDFYDMAPPEVQEVLNTAKRTHNERKQELIDQLIGATTNEEMKEKLTANFMSKDIDELEILAAAFNRPERSDANPFSTNFIGNAGSPRFSKEDLTKDREAFLPLPTLNWETAEN